MVPAPVQPHTVLILRLWLTALTILAFAGRPAWLGAEPPRALPVGEQPADVRLNGLRTLNSYFPFHEVHSVEQWKHRAGELRRRILVATGLWPLPTRTAMHPVIHGLVDREDYTVEKVYFQSLPGHYVTGNLYRPKGYDGPRPGILTPHGHWRSDHGTGRFYAHDPKRAREEIAAGAERFEEDGRYPLQSRCVQLARMGCVVFIYDMIGYADSIQLDHRPGVRASMNTPDNWGFFSPQAELRLQNMMGLQTWNSIRALDFLASLPDVDAERIGVTGASGGGTQTFILCAIDDRPGVAAPAVMVSTAMQGGCTCENAPLLRIDAGNVDFAACFAPKPLALIGANDWTKEIETKGLPELKRLYAMLGHEDHLYVKANLQFGHNYNAVSRAIMYNWMNRHLRLNFDEPVIEQHYKPLSTEEASVWNREHPRPTGEQVGEAHERAVVRWLNDDAQRHLRTVVPHDAASLQKFREIVGRAFEIILGGTIDNIGPVEHEVVEKIHTSSYLRMTALLNRPRAGEQLPALFFHPDDWNGQVVIWITERGKSGLLDESADPIAPVKRLLDGGFSVMGVDLFAQGEFLKQGHSLDDSGIVRPGQNVHQYAGYTFGYNPALFAWRVHDILTAISFVHTDERSARRIHLVGVDATGPLVIAARAMAGDVVDKTIVHTHGFRFQSLARIDDPDFLPGAVKYFDLPGLMALCAPHPLWLLGEGKNTPDLVVNAYQAAQSEAALQVPRDPSIGKFDGAMDWLMR